MKHGAVYILTNKNHVTLYVGVTSNLEARLEEHQSKKHPNGFTARYNLDKLVYDELFHRIEEAILREKQIKGGSRKKKEELIRSMNPDWQDLREQLS
jgi:putative endonuclease